MRRRGMRVLTMFALVLFLFSVATPVMVSQDVKTLSSTLAKSITASGRRNVAVVDFTDLQGNVTELGRFLAEEFSVDLLGEAKGFEVIDRTHLKAILQEHRLATTGLIDPQTARKLGQIAGVDALVTGTIVPLGDSVRLSAKVLDTNTAKMLGAATAEIPKTKTVEELLQRGIGSTARVDGAPSQPPPTVRSPEFRTESYRIVAESMRKVDDKATLLLNVDAVRSEVTHLELRECSLLDESGERWEAAIFIQNFYCGDSAQISQAGWGCAGVDLLPNSKVRSQFWFKARGSTAGTLFSLNCIEGSPRNGRTVHMENIPLKGR